MAYKLGGQIITTPELEWGNITDDINKQKDLIALLTKIKNELNTNITNERYSRHDEIQALAVKQEAVTTQFTNLVQNLSSANIEYKDFQQLVDKYVQDLKTLIEIEHDDRVEADAELQERIENVENPTQLIEQVKAQLELDIIDLEAYVDNQLDIINSNILSLETKFNNDLENLNSTLMEHVSEANEELEKSIKQDIEQLQSTDIEIQEQLISYNNDISNSLENVSTNIDEHIANENNPHNVTLTQLGLNINEYAKNEDLPTKVSELDNDVNYLTQHQSLEDYAKSSEVQESVENVLDYVNTNFYTANESDRMYAPLNNDYASQGDILELKESIPSLTGYATETYVKEYAQPVGNYLTSIPSNYITDVELDERGFVTNDAFDAYIKEFVESYAQPKGDYLTEIPSEYITEEELNAKGFLTEHQPLEDYALKTDIPTDYAKANHTHNEYLTEIPDNYITKDELDLSGFALKSEVATKEHAHDEYANKDHVHDQYITEHQDLSQYALKSEIPTDYAKENHTHDNYASKEHTHEQYLTEHQDLSNYVTKDEVSELSPYTAGSNIDITNNVISYSGRNIFIATSSEIQEGMQDGDLLIVYEE